MQLLANLLDILSYVLLVSPTKNPFCVDLFTKGYSSRDDQAWFLCDATVSRVETGECEPNFDTKFTAILLEGSDLNCTKSGESLVGLSKRLRLENLKSLPCIGQMSILTKYSTPFLAILKSLRPSKI